MDGNKIPAQQGRPGLFRRAARSVQQFFTRALIPAPAREPPALPEDEQAQKGSRQSFSNAIFAELLIELPMHRARITRAGNAGDMDTLGNAVHQLLGAVSYCDAPELEEALRELRLAVKTDDPYTIDIYHGRAVNVIDSTLRYSGYRAHE